MKKFFVGIIMVLLVFCSCSTLKKTDKVADNKQVTTTHVNKQQPNTTNKDKEKALKEQRKQEIAHQKQLTKEAQKKKKEEEKIAKQKQKEQDDLIAKSQKEEKEKLKQERKKEKEALKETEQQQEKKEKGESSLKKAADFVLKGGDENQESDKNASEDVMKEIMYGKDTTTNKDKDVTVLTKEQKKQIIEQSKKADKKKEGNFVKRTFRKAFPKKVDRDLTYSNIYKEKPKTIMIMYPWNRSKDENADEMFYVAATKELNMKGYYVLPIVPTMNMYKDDTMLSSHYVNTSNVKEFKDKYGVDAVLFVTIYRFEKPWWSTNVNVVADYNMISTKTNDTLFTRKADFNYDTPIPAKEKRDKQLLSDENEAQKLGVMEQMQRYVFLDLPVGPYSPKYLSDQKKFSHQKQMKYKVDVRPS
jgi:hypothetical protein